MEDIINRVKFKHDTLLDYISAGIDKELNMMLVYLSGTYAFKRPNWFGYNSQTYDATKLKDKILEEFKNKTGMYGYGILLGKQPSGYCLLCIDIDIDNECKDEALEALKKIFDKYKISYAVETTKSNRYHVYVAVDGLTDTLKNTKKLRFREDCIKYKGVKPLQGEIELLGASNPHMATVYTGIINDEEPFYINQLIVISAETFELALLEFQGIFEETKEIKVTKYREIDTDMLIGFFKLVRKHNYTNGWDIDKIVSSVCVGVRIPDEDIHRIFEEIYQGDYDKRITDYIIERTKEKDPQYLPSVASVIYHAKKLAKDNQLDDEEKKFLSNFISSFKNHTIGNYELPYYLLDAEKVYFVDSIEKQNKDKLTYYRERWFIERNIDNTKQVWHVEIETIYPGDIYKPHRKVGYSKIVGIKIDINKLLKEQKNKVYEIIINDDHIFRPSFAFDKVEEIVKEIERECHDLLAHFDVPLFLEYFNIKIMEYLKKHNGKPVPCIISKTTGWNEDFTMFFHYDLNDDKHELSKDHPLYKYAKAQSPNIERYALERQHKLVFDLLNEGKLLGVLIVISAASILLKPLDLQPLTTILAGNPGTGKTTASLIATSLFYKSDNILINADTTKVGVELTLSSFNSLPFVVDEGALAAAAANLKHLIFSVASGKGRTRGRKDLTVHTNDIISNVFWTTETSDIDEIRRSGAFRRMLYITTEKWEQFTSLFDIKSERPNKQYAGCGVDYIKYVMNPNTLGRIEWSSKSAGEVYSELAGVATTIFAGIRLLEIFYEQFYKKEQLTFEALRKTVKALLKEAQRIFISSRDDVVFALQQYLYSNLYRFGQVDVERDENGRVRMRDGNPVYKVTRPNTEALGEYDMFTQTFYITLEGFKKIAKELEKERSILENALANAGVMRKGENSRYSRVLGRNMRFYEIKFNDLPSEPSQDEKLDIPF